MTQNMNLGLEISGHDYFAGGVAFGKVGAYERIWGRVTFSVDPLSAPYNMIVDLDKVACDARGQVSYSSDFFILKPKEMDRGNSRLLFEVGNRGSKLLLQLVNDAVQSEWPNSPGHAGNGFLFRRGYTMVWCAWQGDILPVDRRMTMEVPVPVTVDGPLTGLVRTEFAPGYDGTGYNVAQSFDGDSGIFSIPLSGNPYTKSYESVSVENADAKLTVREYETDRRVEIPHHDWAFARLDSGGNRVPSPTSCFLRSGFKRGWIYELIYRAKNPLVLGLGFTAIRDFVSFLRYRPEDDIGCANPLYHRGKGVEKAYGWGCSQSARCLREFVYRGFNEDVDNRPVFDAINPFVSGAGRVTLNYRFAQPGRYPRQHFDHLYPSDQFPFAYGRVYDPLTRKSDAILKRPQSDPLVIHTQSSAEYWQRRGSLVHTNSGGEDLPEHPMVRVYLFAGAEHSADPLSEPDHLSTRFPTNPLNVSAFQRALIDAMDAWASQGIAPPLSQVPRRSAGTALTASEVAQRFEILPELRPPESANRLFVQDFGKRFEHGEFFGEPPKEYRELEYQIWVPMIDSDGNESVGIRGVDLQVPIATYTGWNFRPKGEAEKSMAAVHGSYFPFTKTLAQRRSNGDCRLSLDERYSSLAEYVKRVQVVAAELVAARFLLEEDAARFIQRAKIGMVWGPLVNCCGNDQEKGGH